MISQQWKRQHDKQHTIKSQREIHLFSCYAIVNVQTISAERIKITDLVVGLISMTDRAL